MRAPTANITLAEAFASLGTLPPHPYLTELTRPFLATPTLCPIPKKS